MMKIWIVTSATWLDAECIVDDNKVRDQFDAMLEPNGQLYLTQESAGDAVEQLKATLSEERRELWDGDPDADPLPDLEWALDTSGHPHYHQWTCDDEDGRFYGIIRLIQKEIES
jgi:hypothetical protein